MTNDLLLIIKWDRRHLQAIMVIQCVYVFVFSPSFKILVLITNSIKIYSIAINTNYVFVVKELFTFQSFTFSYNSNSFLCLQFNSVLLTEDLGSFIVSLDTPSSYFCSVRDCSPSAQSVFTILHQCSVSEHRAAPFFGGGEALSTYSDAVCENSYKQHTQPTITSLQYQCHCCAKSQPPPPKNIQPKASQWSKTTNDESNRSGSDNVLYQRVFSL